MNTIRDAIQSQKLLEIKRIIDSDDNGDKFVILRTDKNVNFMREHNLNDEDVKNIIRNLSVSDCYSGPEDDRDSRYDGWVFKFKPMYEGIELYIKIRVESQKKSVCISVHKSGEYDEES